VAKADKDHRVAFTGVNIAGGEFKSNRIPGHRDKDYVYPRARDFDPFARLGMNAVRMPLLWERLQPVPLGELDQKELAAVDAAVASLEPKAALIILDIHNYGRYRGAVLTERPELQKALPDLWRRLAIHYAVRSKVAFGIMNEPHDMTAEAWADIARKTLLAIRGAGARNLILVPGSDWSGAHSWTRSNAAAFSAFSDPANNFLFEMHQYLDQNSSGTSNECPVDGAGSTRLRSATIWLRQHRQKAFLGEFGAAATPDCLKALDELLTFVDANSDVWTGWTYWAAGPWLGNYPYGVQPRASGDRPQTQVLVRHVPN
jgi:endoglucanase